MSELAKKLAAKVAAASVSGGGNLIRHGKYVFCIKQILCEKKYKGECFIMELLVIESEKVEVVENGVVKNIEPNKAGSDASYVVNFDGKGKESAGGNVKQVICALFNINEDDLKPDEFEDTFEDIVRSQTSTEKVKDENGVEQSVVKDANPMRGWVVRCSTYPKEVRSRKGEFITGLKWENLAPPGEGENAEEKILERRKMLDGMKAKA